ncbi:MAG: OmpH family outer membrane protein [Verrucomicrobiota bacterium]
MKKNILSLCGALILGLTTEAIAELKIAIVDLEKVFNSYYKTEEAQARLKDQENSYKKELSDRQESFQKLMEQHRELKEAVEDPSLADSAKEDKLSRLKDKEQEIMSSRNKINEFLQTTRKLTMDQTQRMRSEILEEMDGTIKSITKGKYNLVLDSTGKTLSGAPAIIHSEGIPDISDDIIAELNKSKPTE